ncbi:MAG: TIGR02587 family membrane protein [Acidimicrobiia bacterium]
MSDRNESPSWPESARAYLRAMGGGLLVGLPLLFTMEVWWHAFLLPPLKIVLLVMVAFIVVVGYTAITGFRRDRTWQQVLVDAVEAFGIAIVVAGAVLLLLRRIEPATGLRDAVGKVALEAIPIAFGAAVGSAQLAAQGEQGSGNRADRHLGPMARLFVGAGGALLFALNVAPTEEPLLLGIEAEWWVLLAVMLASFLMTLGIVFYADFRGGKSGEPDGPLSTPLGETTSAYALSLLVSLLLLWSFGRTDGASAQAIFGQMVMLALVASFGAAAGRLLVGGGP